MTNDHKHEFFAVENIEKSNFNTKSTLQFLSSLKIDNISQIREQMCLETHFQYEFSFLGHFGQSGLQREKKIQTAIPKYATFEASFFMSSWAKNIYLKKKIHYLASALKS